MENIKTLLIANRGEIAVRIARTASAHNVRTISIYTAPDATSLHVRATSTAVLLPAPATSAYTDADAILRIAKEHHADAIIPGYGFLSENAAFARKVHDQGFAWCGPSASVIEQFGVKHIARHLAEDAGVPIVPGSKGLVDGEEEAVEWGQKLGWPIMLKATGGGGGMGLVVCKDEGEVREGFRMVKSRSKTLFGDDGVFVEKYFEKGRHVEVQIFGNGMGGEGSVVGFGERECSVQRRHQKVVEECPSPFVAARNDGGKLRRELVGAAVRLAESVSYGSAGTVEFLVDDETGDFFFLEMNTRLQVEHGITEMCYGIDLVELMLRQADAELGSKAGLDAKYLEGLQRYEPDGAAVEARVYAENAVREFRPSPGLLQKVVWKEIPGSRIDTWVFTGSSITPHYDPLIAKVMYHAPSREEAIKGTYELLSGSQLCGPPTNLEFLAAIMQDSDFNAGKTLTSFLKTFTFSPSAIDVIQGGAYTLVQDLGRPAVGKGIPHSGAMDPVAFQIANMLVGNPRDKEGLEITLAGPELRFIGPAVIALCGAPMEATLDGETFPLWTRRYIKAGQKLKIGKTTGGGCRAYLAVYGGFPTVAEYFGSKSTSPLVAIGGYQGRALASGDLLSTINQIPDHLKNEAALPDRLIPKYSNEWEIMAMVGPHEEGYLLPEDVEIIYSTKWKVSHNASRSGIRLIGPVPKWARNDGGEGGSHPSNLIEYGYPIGALNWTGDDPCIFPVDCPNFGGFVSSTTVVRADWWKLGQIKAGDMMQYRRVSLEEALAVRKDVEAFLSKLEGCFRRGANFDEVEPLDKAYEKHLTPAGHWGKAIIWERAAGNYLPAVKYRQGGDDHLIVEYGGDSFDLNHRCRVTALENLLRGDGAPSWLKDALINTVGCCNSTTLFYDGSTIDRSKLVSHLQHLEGQLGDLSTMKVPTRRFKLPITFRSRAQEDATKRYMETQRPYAPYLPSNFDFVARNNAFTPQQLKEIFLTGAFMTVVVGFFCGNTVSLPVDPRQRISCPKQNPSRVFTPEGTAGWGGSCLSIYPVDSPGGYQMLGRTVPCFDYLMYKKDFEHQPWLFQDFDLMTFYEVSEEEMDEILADFRSGRYNFQWEKTEFDMTEHNQMLRDTEKEVKEIRQKQMKAQEQIVQEDNESLERWRKEKAASKVDPSTVDQLLNDPAITPITAPVDANVWKVEVDEGSQLKAGQVIVILEAMKLEIAVRVPEDIHSGSRVEKLLVSAGETVKAGGNIALLKA